MDRDLDLPSHLPPLSVSSSKENHRSSSPLLREESSGNDAPKTDPVSSNSLPPTRLHRSSYILVLTLFYAALAIFAWAVTSFLALGPVSAKSYGPFKFSGGLRGYEGWYRAARIVQSIVSVSAIPLTSAVCSAAAAVFVQQRGPSTNLTLRQLLTLADKGWSDPTTYARTFPGVRKDGWKRYGSTFLLLAMVLTTLGSIILPLQEILLVTETIKTPAEPQGITCLLDIHDQFTTLDSK